MTGRRQTGLSWSVLALALLVAAIAALAGLPGAAGAVPPGSQLWFKDLDPLAGRPGGGIDIAVAADGSVYALGQVERQVAGNPGVVLLTKYSAGGVRRWTKTYGVPDHVLTHPHAMALDGEGNVVIAGFYENAPHTGNGLVVKFSPVGKRLWVKKYDGPARGDDAFFDVGCDAAGNVYVCGMATATSVNTAAIVRKYSPAGAVRWTRKATGFGAETQASALVVKRDTGTVWITGALRHLKPGEPPVLATDVRTAKYSAAGKLLWSRLWTSPGNVKDVGRAIALEADGEVYVAGSVMNTNVGHAAVLNYGGGGLHWAVNDAAASPVMSLQVRAIGVDRYGRARLLGTYYEDGYDPAHVAMVRTYEASGSVAWEHQIHSGDHSVATALTVQSNGTLFAAGYARHIGMIGEELPYSLWVVRHQSDGTRPWTFVKGGGWSGPPYVPRAVAFRDGRLYVAGEYGIGDWRGFALRLLP